MNIFVYGRQHYIPMDELQSSMSLTDVEFKRELELYSYQCKPLEMVDAENVRCASCKTAVLFLKWFLDNSYRTHPDINTLKHELSKFTKKIPKRKLSRSMRIELAYRQQYKCRMCEVLLPPDFQVDHIEALEDGGADVASNLQCLCVPCHTTKTRLNRLRKTQQFAEEATVQHEAFARPLSPPDSAPVFSKYFSEYQKN